ncbi:unnamed protein product, partial [Auanema sp. JU1783]
KTDKILDSFIEERRIRWKFITPHSPWKGGFYEKMIGVTKKILTKNLGIEAISLNELAALLSEVENIVNNRPLTNIASCFDRVITPLSLEVYHPSNLKHNSLDSERKDLIENKNDVKTWMEKNNKIIRNIWEDWSAIYIEELRVNHTRFGKGGNYSIQTPKVGDIVMCVESNTKRNKWPLARIEQLIVSEDGQIRTVIIRNKEHNKLRKSVNHLIPLELDQQDTVSTSVHIGKDVQNKQPIRDEQVFKQPIRDEQVFNQPIRDELLLGQPIGEESGESTLTGATVHTVQKKTNENEKDELNTVQNSTVQHETHRKDISSIKERNLGKHEVRGFNGAWEERLRDIPKKSYSRYF